MKQTNKKKKGSFNFVLKIFLVFLIIIVLVLLGIILVRGKSIDSSDDQITKLYSYLGSNDLEKCNGLFTYDTKKVTAKSLDLETKICNSYLKVDSKELKTLKIDKTKKQNTCSVSDEVIFATDNYEESICTVTEISAQLVADKYYEIYGEKLTEFNTFTLDNKTICFYEDDKYYCGLSETYTYTVGAVPKTYRSIKNSFEKDDTIVIYDYFVKIVNDECYTSYQSEDKNEGCTDNYNEKKVDNKFLKRYGTLYKHTFKLNKDNKSYQWVKSEPSN